jgi:hypothetical protein
MLTPHLPLCTLGCRPLPDSCREGSPCCAWRSRAAPPSPMAPCTSQAAPRDVAHAWPRVIPAWRCQVRRCSRCRNSCSSDTLTLTHTASCFLFGCLPFMDVWLLPAIGINNNNNNNSDNSKQRPCTHALAYGVDPTSAGTTPPPPCTCGSWTLCGLPGPGAPPGGPTTPALPARPCPRARPPWVAPSLAQRHYPLCGWL